MKLPHLFAPGADFIRAVDKHNTSGPKIYIGKTSLSDYLPITTCDNVRIIYDAVREYQASGIEKACNSYLENSSKSLSALFDDIPADVKESIEKNESKIDLPIRKYTEELAHWCAMISNEDDEEVSIFTLGGADIPIGRALEIKEVRREDPGFDDECKRYTWNFVSGCKERSLRAGLDMMRWKARMINERGTVYNLDYNCQTTTMEIVLAGSWNPTYAARSISFMWIGS